MSDIVIYGQDSSFLLAIDVNHPDDDLTPLPTDFIQVEPPAINPQKNSELHLLPLPTDFDPSAEPTELIIGAGNEHLSANDLESQSEEVIEALSTNSKDNPADHAEGGDGDHGAAVTARDDDRTLREILESLARTKGEEDGVDMAKKPVTVMSSPLSEVPDLPTQLPPTPELQTKSLPNSLPTVPSPTVNFASSSSIPAESSATAARRAVGSKSSLKVTKKLCRKRKGQALDDDLESLSGAEELKEIGDIMEDGTDGDAKKGAKKHKKSKGRDGKAARVTGPARKQLDAVMGIEPDGTSPPKKIAPRRKVLNDAQILKSLKGKTSETQMSMCQKPRYSIWGKCTQCVAKQGGDSCRFRDYRKFKIDPETAEILGPGRFESTDYDETMTSLPTTFNVPLQERHLSKTERTIAPFLLPLITRELRHVSLTKAIKREVDTAKHRSVCDFCSSTIFGGFFFCEKCGKDFCLQCERYFSDSPETMLESPWEIPPAARPRLQRCTGGSDKVKGKNLNFHSRPDLQPVSRFTVKELKEHWLALVDFVLDAEASEEDRLRLLGITEEEDELSGMVKTWIAEHEISKDLKSGHRSAMSAEGIAGLYQKNTNPSVIPIPDPAHLEDLSLPFIFISADNLDNDKFDFLWGRGEPIVVNGVGKRLKHTWTPDTFIERFGSEPCYVVNCESNASLPMNIAKFFGMWNNTESRPDKVLKLKDWPATKDFQSAYPDLYNDFCDSLPVPDCTRRDGVLNLYSHFPPGPTRPDIGPKMYNAFAGKETSGGNGSTRLHMDVADAINIMLYASPRSDGQPGCAVWDLFRAEDADKLRKFLTKKCGGREGYKFTDPIHSQLFYLNSSLRKELLAKHGVVSWRVYQYPGQAVFIPAGCAHQVCNLADCIKIALDFVSPHNVVRCQQLVLDFRRENFAKAWKEDVLQLYNVMWYSWLNVRETRNRWQAEAVAKEAAATARASYLASLQNGDHVTLSSSLSSTSPKRNGNLTPAVSFVRDEPSEAVPPTNGETKIPTDVSETVIILEDTNADLSSDLIPAEKTRHVNGDASAAPKSVKKAVQLDPKRILAQCLLEAALSRPEPDPKKPIPVGRPVAPPPQPLQLPRISMKDMVKLKMLPIDFAVNLARSAMGEGTEDDELVEETRLEGENDGGIQFTSARGDGMAGGVADPILVDAQGIDVEQDDQLAIGTLQDVETEMGLELVLDGIDIDQLDGDLF